jgi:hypothetical protein
MKRGKFCNHSEAVKELFFFCPRPFQDGSLSGTTLTGLVLFLQGLQYSHEFLRPRVVKWLAAGPTIIGEVQNFPFYS